MKAKIAALVLVALFLTSCSKISSEPFQGYATYVESMSHTVIIEDDGNLWGWGNQTFFSLGYTGDDYNGNYVDRPLHIMDDVKTVKLDISTTAIIRNDNSLWGLGLLDISFDKEFEYYLDGVAVKPIKIMENVKDVSMGGGNFFIVTNDNVLYGVGKNAYGSLGLGDKDPRYSIEKIMDGVIYVSSNNLGTTFIIKEDSTFWGIGNNLNGELNNTAMQDSLEPIFITDNVKIVKQDISGNYLIKHDASLWTWGRNYNVGLVEQNTPLTQITDNVLQIEKLSGGIGILKEDSTLWFNETELSTFSLSENIFSYNPVYVSNDVIDFSSSISGDYLVTKDGKLLGINGILDDNGNLFSLEGLKQSEEPIVIMAPYLYWKSQGSGAQVYCFLYHKQ